MSLNALWFNRCNFLLWAPARFACVEKTTTISNSNAICKNASLTDEQESLNVQRSLLRLTSSLLKTTEFKTWELIAISTLHKNGELTSFITQQLLLLQKLMKCRKIETTRKDFYYLHLALLAEPSQKWNEIKRFLTLVNMIVDQIATDLNFADIFCRFLLLFLDPTNNLIFKSKYNILFILVFIIYRTATNCFSVKGDFDEQQKSSDNSQIQFLA